MPNKIFISYRRKESQDITGRIHDGIAGYFGADAVFMDVDALVSGKEYRTQIGSLIKRCNVLLAIIGEEWLQCTDEEGRRRIDDPEDLLRIELQTAIENGLTVVPILVHGATMPAADELPESLAPLARQQPVEIQSGLPFRTDIRQLIDRLETHHGIHHPDHRFPWELLAIPCGIVLILIAIFSQPYVSNTQMYAIQQTDPTIPLDSNKLAGRVAPEGTIYNREYYHQELLDFFYWHILPGGLGPIMIVFGSTVCCGRKDRQRKRAFYLTGVMQVPSAKSRKAVICLALGLASISWGLVAAVPALVLGLAAFGDLHRYHGWMRGRSLAWLGVLGAVVGGTFATYWQYDLRRLDAWLASMQQANQWERENQPDRALEACAAALHLDIGPIGSCTVFGKESALLVGQGKPQAAVVSLSKSIDIALERLTSNSANDGLWHDVLEQAHQARAILYDELGQLEKAKADRNWRDRLLPDSFPPANAEPWDGTPGAGPAPIPIESDSAPTPPMPVVE